MITSSPFGNCGDPAELIDHMIGEEYGVVKAVADALPQLPAVTTAINAIGGLAGFVTSATAAKDQALAGATEADAARDLALQYRDTTKSYRDDAQSALAGSQAAEGLAQAAAVVATTQATNGAASAGVADTHRLEASASAVLSQKWATQTVGEVVPGQGYGAQKYANDASGFSVSAGGSATAAEAARAAAALIKGQVVAIAGFDPTVYASIIYARHLSKRAAYIYGSR